MSSVDGMTVDEPTAPNQTSPLTTTEAVEAIAWERAPRDTLGGWVNLRVRCADGFVVSVQASSRHYANDRDGGAPYWRGDREATAYPFTTFEVGYPSSNPKPKKVWREYDSGGVWAWVPRQVVADLLDSHGGAVAWEPQSERDNDA